MTFTILSKVNILIYRQKYQWRTWNIRHEILASQAVCQIKKKRVFNVFSQELLSVSKTQESVFYLKDVTNVISTT